MTPVPGQVGDSPQPPGSQTGRGVSPFLLIGLVVVILLLLVGVGSLLYTLGQQHSSKPGTTPTPGITPTPTPTPGTTPTPTPTPRITPTATALQASDSGRTVMLLSMHNASSNTVSQTSVNTFHSFPDTSIT
jgi:hypothetical protein